MSELRVRTTVVGGADDLGDLEAPPGSRLWAIGVRAQVLRFMHDQEISAARMRAHLDAMARYEGWRHLTDARDRPFRSYEAFCRAEPPFGLGYAVEHLDRIVEERRSVQARAEQPQLLLDHGRPEKAAGKGVGSTLIRGSTNADYLTARIKRDRPDVLERMQAGEFADVRAAADAAGIPRPPARVTLPLEPERLARTLRTHLTPAQLAALVAALTAPEE